MAASNTSAAPPSRLPATWPTRSPDHYSRPADSDHDYTLDCDEPLQGPETSVAVGTLRGGRRALSVELVIGGR